eukprot:6123439-Prymnesium_polylepis.1
MVQPPVGAGTRSGVRARHPLRAVLHDAAGASEAIVAPVVLRTQDDAGRPLGFVQEAFDVAPQFQGVVVDKQLPRCAQVQHRPAAVG